MKSCCCSTALKCDVGDCLIDVRVQAFLAAPLAEDSSSLPSAAVHEIDLIKVLEVSRPSSQGISNLMLGLSKHCGNIGTISLCNVKTHLANPEASSSSSTAKSYGSFLKSLYAKESMVLCQVSGTSKHGGSSRDIFTCHAVLAPMGTFQAMLYFDERQTSSSSAVLGLWKQHTLPVPKAGQQLQYQGKAADRRSGGSLTSRASEPLPTSKGSAMAKLPRFNGPSKENLQALEEHVRNDGVCPLSDRKTVVKTFEGSGMQESLGGISYGSGDTPFALMREEEGTIFPDLQSAGFYDYSQSRPASQTLGNNASQGHDAAVGSSFRSPRTGLFSMVTSNTVQSTASTVDNVVKKLEYDESRSDFTMEDYQTSRAASTTTFLENDDSYSYGTCKSQSHCSAFSQAVSQASSSNIPVNQLIAELEAAQSNIPLSRGNSLSSRSNASQQTSCTPVKPVAAPSEAAPAAAASFLEGELERKLEVLQPKLTQISEGLADIANSSMVMDQLHACLISGSINVITCAKEIAVLCPLIPKVKRSPKSVLLSTIEPLVRRIGQIDSAVGIQFACSLASIAVFYCIEMINKLVGKPDTRLAIIWLVKHLDEWLHKLNQITMAPSFHQQHITLPGLASISSSTEVVTKMLSKYNSYMFFQADDHSASQQAALMMSPTTTLINNTPVSINKHLDLIVSIIKVAYLSDGGRLSEAIGATIKVHDFALTLQDSPADSPSAIANKAVEPPVPVVSNAMKGLMKGLKRKASDLGLEDAVADQPAFMRSSSSTSLFPSSSSSVSTNSIAPAAVDLPPPMARSESISLLSKKTEAPPRFQTNVKNVIVESKLSTAPAGGMQKKPKTVVHSISSSSGGRAVDQGLVRSFQSACSPTPKKAVSSRSIIANTPMSVSPGKENTPVTRSAQKRRMNTVMVQGMPNLAGNLDSSFVSPVKSLARSSYFGNA